MQRRSTSRTAMRKASLSRKRPCRFLENVECSGTRTLEAEPAEPAIGQVQVDLLAQPSLGADAEAVADDQHADHQLRIDRRAARCGCRTARDAAAGRSGRGRDRCREADDQRDVILEVECVEELFLRDSLLSHHRGVTPSLVALSLQTLQSDGGSPSFSTE